MIRFTFLNNELFEAGILATFIIRLIIMIGAMIQWAKISMAPPKY